MTEIQDLLNNFVRTIDNDQAHVLGQTQRAIQAVAEIALPDPEARGTLLLALGYSIATEAGLSLEQIFDAMRIWDGSRSEIEAAAKRSAMHVVGDPEEETP